MTSPAERAQVLAALVETLLPGDGLFPSAAAVGLQAKLADRLVATADMATLEKLTTTLDGLRDATGDNARRDLVAGFERDEPDLFARVRAICYTGYYESPLVQAAIHELGFAYNAAPLPDGYPLSPFDPATDRPTHGRGHYVPTDQVQRVDLSNLDIEELRHGG